MLNTWLGALIGVIVAGVVIYIISILNIQTQEQSVSAVQQRAVRTSEMGLLSMVEFDFQNIGSNFPSFDNPPDFAITAYDTASSTKVFQFIGQTQRWSQPDTVRYEWSKTGTKKIKRDGAYVDADVYSIKRYVNGALNGSSSGMVTRFQVRLRTSDGSPVADISETRQIMVGVSMAANIGSSTLLGETHWDTIIRPAAMARLDYEDYVEV